MLYIIRVNIFYKIKNYNNNHVNHAKNIHKYYTKENNKKNNINSTYSILRNWLYYRYNLEKNIIKIIKKII